MVDNQEKTPQTVTFYRAEPKQHDENDVYEEQKPQYRSYQEYYSRGLDPKDFL